ncbi:hypothetical protein M413DRAFT_11987 [Hebeloma cylindrosporum]|uniref:Galactose oxidase n=1 Tax=Hebeloma cylindrosporum TaxID=76867 RepID=A0A0C2YFT8_HEBCY|nr:hypothetical protein M413DRAFT_11987 [Hebeloma cylindrosporum h7]
MSPRVLQWTLCFLTLSRSLLYCVGAYDAIPRWGQAVAMINDALFVHAGKTDEFNSYSYTSAPNTNDVIYLSLSSSFSADSPPWELVSSSVNATTSQGPSLAWGTLSKLDSSSLLLFGGQPGPNSPTVIVGAADSAAILDVKSPTSPTWISEPASWANEPVRRIRHSSVTSPSGSVFIIGGEKADGSNTAFSDHYIFNPVVSSFALLPPNGPPDVYGHASVLLSDGRILVFGDTTQSTLSWTMINTATTSLPSPRMAFAATSIPNGKVLIQGGSDASLQTNVADGWILDTTQNPMTWSQVPALSQVGARRDHFAVSSGDLVVFGFGYGNDSPAPVEIQIFNSSSQAFLSSFTPPAVTSTSSPSSPSQTSQPNSPTHASSTGRPPATSATTNPGVGTGGSSNNSGDGNRNVAIAMGTSFGLLGLVVIGLGVAYYIRHRNRANNEDRRFTALGGSDDGADSPHFGRDIPVAGMQEMGEVHGHRGLLSSLGIAGALGAVTRMRSVQGYQQYQRRDMLADEDTRSFGEWYNARRRDGTGGSSWSLRSILGGGSRLRSREASMTSHASAPWREKTDPFSDGAALMRDEETSFVETGYGSRPQARRELSHASHTSARSAYRDPFVDPISEERTEEIFGAGNLYMDDSEKDGEYTLGRPSVRHVTSLPPIRTILPLSQQIGQPLSSLSERTSQSTLPLPNPSSSLSSHGRSSENVLSPFPGGSLSRATSLTSDIHLTPGSPTAKSTSLIGGSDPAILNNNQPMKRSDSWWSRFARSSLLDRRSNDASKTMYEIRDPNPAPRLLAIEEASSCSTPHKQSPKGSSSESPGSVDQAGLSHKPSPRRQRSLSRANSTKLYGVGHGKSMTSVKTADSEAIERMAGNMDVVQRVKSGSRWGSGSTGSIGGLSIKTHASDSEAGDRSSAYGGVADTQEDLMLFASPMQETNPRPPHSTEDPFEDPSPLRTPFRTTFAPTTPKSPKVAERIQAYERRMSQDQTSPLPLNSKNREERTKKRVEVDYGLVPRPSLFVANPDHRVSQSSVDS